MGGVAFTGWPPEAIDFFEGLEQDNSKSYWTAHRAVYDEAVLGPMTELTQELTGEFGPVRILRPYRDIRFSADKTPYRTDIAAGIGSGFVRFSADGLGAGNGMYLLAPDQLERYRRAVADDLAGGELGRVAEAITGRPLGQEGDGGIGLMSHDRLRTAPRGYSPDHPRIWLLRHKGLAAWQDWPAGPWLATAQPKDRVRDFLVATAPLTDWLNAHVGPSSMPEGRRR